MRAIILISISLFSVLVYATEGMPDCSEIEEFGTSVHGTLLSELLPINVDSPEDDAKIRFKNGDYRLLRYGDFSGIKIPDSELLEKNEICRYGVKVLPGMSDAFESSEHRILLKNSKIILRNTTHIFWKD